MRASPGGLALRPPPGFRARVIREQKRSHRGGKSSWPSRRSASSCGPSTIKILDSSAAKIVETATRTGATVSGPIPLPTEKNIYTILTAPNGEKDIREQFEMRTHKRLIDIIEPGSKTVEALMKLDLPAGVDIEIKL